VLDGLGLVRRDGEGVREATTAVGPCLLRGRGGVRDGGRCRSRGSGSGRGRVRVRGRVRARHAFSVPTTLFWLKSVPPTAVTYGDEAGKSGLNFLKKSPQPSRPQTPG